MKRLIGFIISISMLFASTQVFVSADDTTVNAYRDGETIVAENVADNSKLAVLNFYNEDKLTYSTLAKAEEDKYTFTVPGEYDGLSMRICYMGSDIYNVMLTETPEPSAEPTIAPTEEPVETATPVPTRTPRPEVYDRALDALNAPAVVKKVSETVIDGETYYTLTMLYQGNEVTTNVRDYVEIVSAPEFSEYLTGQSAGALEEGDVIHFTTDLQGRIKSIEFIYRPDFEDYINEGTDCGSGFAKLYGSDGYSTFAFGVPVKTTNGSVLLADETGTVTDIDVNTKAFIYNVSSLRRNNIVSLEGTGSKLITTTYIPKDGFDDEDNVISWEGIDDITYALVRIVDGTATEVIVFGE